MSQIIRILLLFSTFFIYNITVMSSPIPLPMPSLPESINANQNIIPSPQISLNKEGEEHVSLQLQMLNELFPPMPPHCSKALVTPIHLSFLEGFFSHSTRNKLNIGVGQTICFNSNSTTVLKDNSTMNTVMPILNTLTLTRLEQYHPITQKYKFAIPEVETKCICDCSIKSNICNVYEYNYGKCNDINDTNLSCYRTFFTNQPKIGCLNGQNEPKLCCELKFKPYKNKTYTALKLELPTTFAVLRYSTYNYISNKWNEIEKRTIRIYLDGTIQNQYLDNLKNFELSINSMSKTSNQLESGMYFVENLNNDKYGEIIQQPLNEITDNNFEKLGWYRQDSTGKFVVNNGYIMMDKIHRAKSENCMEQKYQSILDANYYINKDSNDSTKFKISDTINKTFKWIKSAKIVDSEERHAIITENEGTNLEIIITTNQKINFIHNSSEIQDFNGKIINDKFSNSILNITVIKASGIINGYITNEDDRNSENIDSFTLYIPEAYPTTKTLQIRVKPYKPNTMYRVCLRPDESMNLNEICRYLESRQDELDKVTMDKRWADKTSECPECNQLNIDGFMKYLNPSAWISGINSVNDFIMMLTDVVVYFSCFLVFYCCMSKICFPIFKCIVCPAYSIIPCFPSKKK